MFSSCRFVLFLLNALQVSLTKAEKQCTSYEMAIKMTMDCDNMFEANYFQRGYYLCGSCTAVIAPLVLK